MVLISSAPGSKSPPVYRSKFFAFRKGRLEAIHFSDRVRKEDIFPTVATWHN